MLELSQSSHLLEQKSYKYQLQDVAEPVLYRDAFNYEEAPKIPFNHRRVPMAMPEDIWITDTTFRDGQQAMDPFSVEQIVTLYKLMSRLSGPKGIIRQSEFFIYSKRTGRPLTAAGSWACATRRSPPGSGPPPRTSSWWQTWGSRRPASWSAAPTTTSSKSCT